MMQRNLLRRGLMMLAMVWTVCPLAHATQHVTLRNGFELDCVRRETIGNKVRLYLVEKTPAGLDSSTNAANYLEVSADTIVHVEAVADVPQSAPASQISSTSSERAPTPAEIRKMLARSGASHDIDIDLLASVVKAESGGQIRALSRAGARGLMQLMPGTATEMGVQDAFRPDQNISAGTAYLDELLTRYRDNIALALAAYNAGPAAVDHYHGVPPYRETKEYVARVIREFNRRKQMTLVAQSR